MPLEDYKPDAAIESSMRQADALLPRAVRGAFASKRYAEPHGSFINLRDDAIYIVALNQLIIAAARYESDGNKLPQEFWSLVDDLAVAVDAVDDYVDWRRNAG